MPCSSVKTLWTSELLLNLQGFSSRQPGFDGDTLPECRCCKIEIY